MPATPRELGDSADADSGAEACRQVGATDY
jgi:hypothetical protein